jgi:hypothetical protein
VAAADRRARPAGGASRDPEDHGLLAAQGGRRLSRRHGLFAGQERPGVREDHPALAGDPRLARSPAPGGGPDRGVGQPEPVDRGGIPRRLHAARRRAGLPPLLQGRTGCFFDARGGGTISEFLGEYTRQQRRPPAATSRSRAPTTTCPGPAGAGARPISR